MISIRLCYQHLQRLTPRFQPCSIRDDGPV
jgi:hypothetical protein